MSDVTALARKLASEAVGWQPDDQTILNAIARYALADTKQMRKELKQQLARFHSQGGRGVELADEIDTLRIAIATRKSSSKKNKLLG